MPRPRTGNTYRRARTFHARTFHARITLASSTPSSAKFRLIDSPSITPTPSCAPFPGSGRGEVHETNGRAEPIVKPTTSAGAGALGTEAKGGVAGPRAAMLTALIEAQRVALEAGDLEAARVAAEAVGRLVERGRGS